jgi:hypothetical protein
LVKNREEGVELNHKPKKTLEQARIYTECKTGQPNGTLNTALYKAGPYIGPYLGTDIGPYRVNSEGVGKF